MRQEIGSRVQAGLRGLLIAVQFLTRLPAPRVSDYQPSDLTRSAVWFPAVGLLIGLALFAIHWIASLVGPSIAALAVVLAWVWVTGALHIDGLADVADAMGAAHRDPARFLTVLRDPHIGTFGVIAIVLVLLAKLMLLVELTGTAPIWPLVLVPAWARFGALAISFAVPPLAPGSGDRFRSEISSMIIAANAVALTAISLWLAPVLLLALPLAGLTILYWRQSLGGITGDCLGASVEVIEVCLLLALAGARAVSG